MSKPEEQLEKKTNEKALKDVENVNSDADSTSKGDVTSLKLTSTSQKQQLKKTLKNVSSAVSQLIGGAFLKCGLFIDSTLRRIHQPFRLILGLAAIGKPIGIFLLMLFAILVTTFLYWGVNTYVLDYDHCFKYHKADESVEFLGAPVPDLPNVYKTESILNKDYSYSITIQDLTVKNKTDGEPILNENENACLYQVERIKGTETDTLFTVKMEREGDSLFLKLLYSDKESEEQREINWYSTNNIASTNEVLRIKETNRAIKSPIFPTNTGAFISWLREYGKDQIPSVKDASIPENDWKLAVAGELERHFENEWYFNDKTYWFLIFGRSFNGTIQFLSVVLFVAALMCLYARNVLLVCHLAAKKDRIRIASGEQLPFTEVKEKDFHNWLKREYDSAVKAQTVFRRAWGCDSSQLFVWEHGLLLFMESDTPHISTLNEIANVQKENLENSRSFVYWLLDSIPALGFVGTVIGISQTMMNTSSVLSNELGKQQSRISEVSMNLAFAFDTTLIALVLALIASFFLSYCVRRENDALNKTQELLIRILNENT